MRGGGVLFEGGPRGMSVDMNSQASDSNEDDIGPNSEEEEEDEVGEDGDIADYYEGVASDVEQQGADSFDPEEYQFTCLSYRESQKVLAEDVNRVASTLKVRRWGSEVKGFSGDKLQTI